MFRYLAFLFAAGALFLEARGASVKYPYPPADQRDGARGASKDFPCPPKDQILPCICSETIDTMELDCSAVENSGQLQTIFHSTPPFPFTHFTKFTMDSNENVDKLENGVFNKIMFDEIEITNSALKEIQEGSVLESASTLKKLTLYGNQIERFLMNDNPDMSMFTQLWHLHLGGNQIGVFPDITSIYLTELLVNDNPIHEIHDENLKGVPNLEKIDISEIGMDTLETKLLTNHTKLKQVSLNNNKLTDVEGTTLKIQSRDMKKIDLSNNRISDVEPDAFEINVNYTDGVLLNFEGNQISTLAETTWKPLIKAGAVLDIAKNPLICGCDIKWVMVPDAGDSTDYKGALKGGTCPQNDDMSIADLDPTWYQNFC